MYPGTVPGHPPLLFELSVLAFLAGVVVLAAWYLGRLAQFRRRSPE